MLVLTAAKHILFMPCRAAGGGAISIDEDEAYGQGFVSINSSLFQDNAAVGSGLAPLWLKLTPITAFCVTTLLMLHTALSPGVASMLQRSSCLQ